MSSRSIVAQKQRNDHYKPNYAPANHIFAETRYIDSQSALLHADGCYWVVSTIVPQQYYRVAYQSETWGTSSTNERFARKLVATVKAYIASQQVAV